jgi:hypothetical protein
VSLRFIVLKGAAGPYHDWSLFTLKRAHSSAIRAALFLTKLNRLSQRRDLQGACQQGTHGRHRDFFHLIERHVQPGALLPPMLPHNDFSPPFGQFFDLLQIFRRQFTRSHVASMQRDMSISPDKILP